MSEYTLQSIFFLKNEKWTHTFFGVDVLSLYKKFFCFKLILLMKMKARTKMKTLLLLGVLLFGFTVSAQSQKVSLDFNLHYS